MAPHPDPPSAERRIGQYRILDQIGRGGMGVIYLAEDERLGRKVAIKVLPAHLTTDTRRRERFRREARAAAALSHPGIAAVFALEEHGDELFIVTEYVRGRTLRSVIDGGGVPPAEVIRIARDVARALHAAHHEGVIHRDLKPDNIMRCDNGAVKVIDFGLARLERDDGMLAAGPLTEPGFVVGTPAYMSPEQLEDRPVDFRADLFAYGIVIYELASGKHPFLTDSVLTTLARLQSGEYTPLDGCVEPALQPLAPVVTRCLQRDRDERFDSTAELVDALERLDSGSRSSGSAVMPAPATKTPSSATRLRVREGERRAVTILACGARVFDSEEFRGDVDPEDFVDMLNEFHDICRGVIATFDGAIVETSEGRVVASFGYPVASERAAIRAADAALALQKRLTEGETDPAHMGLTLTPSIGLHTGTAVVETKENAIVVVGEARTTAIELQRAAEPGQILCSEPAHRLLASRFDSTPLAPLRIKGSPNEVEVMVITRVRPVADVARGTLSPLTGRDLEVNLLRDRWEQACDGMGQVVVIVGEPGLGKSRLVHTLREHVREHHGAMVIEWRCSEHYQNSGFYPVSEYYQRFLGLDQHGSSDETCRRLTRYLNDCNLEPSQTVPLLASLLAVTCDACPRPDLSPVRWREETLRTLRECLDAHAARRPVLFIVEDLHWVDASTLEFLSRFAVEGMQPRILTVLTCRPEFKAPWPAQAHHTTLALTRLTRHQMAEMIQRKLAIADISDSVLGQLYQRTEGVPLFVEEFATQVEWQGGLHRREIPATLQDLLIARLERMNADREIVQLAATIGRQFTYELLAAAASREAGVLDAELAKLVESDILHQKGRPPTANYTFKHALLGDAAYNSLLKTRRRQLHARVANVLQTNFEAVARNHPELVAHHLTEAGDVDQAIGYWLQAGLRSRDRSANIEAMSHLQRGLALLEDADRSPAREALAVQFLTALGVACISTRGYGADEVGPIFARARALCADLGDARQLFAVTWGSWAWSLVRGDLDVSTDLAHEAVELATKAADPGMTMEAAFPRAVTSFFKGDFGDAHEASSDALAIYDDRERTKSWMAYTGEDSGVALRAYLALSLWHLGYPEQALTIAREMIGLAREIGHRYTLAFALEHATWLYQHCRMAADAIDTADEEIEIAAEEGFAYWQASASAFRAGGLVLDGRTEDGLAAMRDALDALRASGAEIAHPYRYSVLGEALLRLRQFSAARQALQEGLEIAERNGDHCYDAELHRLRGELASVESPDLPEAAEAHFLRAIETARHQHSRGWELRAATSLARLLHVEGREHASRRVLADVYGTFSEGLELPDLVDARAVLSHSSAAADSRQARHKQSLNRS